MTAVPKDPRKPEDVFGAMTVEEFVAWDDGHYELVEGMPRLMAPHSEAHAIIQSNVGALVRTHLATLRGPCHPLTEGGVRPRVRSKHNYRKPDLGVSCTPHVKGSKMAQDPVLLIEILSTNVDETRDNIAWYTTIPSVREIVLFHQDRRLAEVWRRGADGWPADPEVTADDVRLQTIDLTLPMDEVYLWVDLGSGSTEEGVTG
jgi:Uma2 family endonuclease